MNELVLTARGKMVVRIIITALVAAAVVFTYNATTPNECKVSVDKMSHACKQLIYEIP